MDYQNYAERIKLLYNFQSFKPPRLDEKEAVRIGTKNSEMTTYKIRKTKFSQLNDKRFYFPNAVLSLPIGHSALKELDDQKRANQQNQTAIDFILKQGWTQKDSAVTATTDNSMET